MVIVGVGSVNPVKVKAVHKAFSRIFNDVKIISRKVDSGVSPQPMTDEEMVAGAINRAKNVFMEVKPDFAVGLEGGLVKYVFGVFVRGWVAVYNGEFLGIASTASIKVPSWIWDKLIGNKQLELEDIMEKITGIEKIGDRMGAFGFLTDERYDREKAFEDAIICALAPIMKHEIYTSKIL